MCAALKTDPSNPPQRPDPRRERATSCVRLAAVGDLLLTTDPAGQAAARDAGSIFAGVKSALAESDIVLGNLECTLPGDGETIATEPLIIATRSMVESVKSGGFDIVTLANNHMFDCRYAGFAQLRGLLDELGIAYFGVGDDLAAATAPSVVTAKGVRIAFIGAVDGQTGVSDFAQRDHYGVAPLEIEQLSDQIARLGSEYHHVIVCLHWGEEKLAIPSPNQLRQAHVLADAGASMILGHHPHVLGGLEIYHDVPIIYSLGNFVSSEVFFSGGGVLRWARRERTGCILLAEMDRERLRCVKQVPTYDSGRSVEIDQTGFGDRHIAHVNRALARGVTLRRYRWEHLRVRTLKPLLGYLRWSKLKTLRLGKIRNALVGIFRAVRAR